MNTTIVIEVSSDRINAATAAKAVLQASKDALHVLDEQAHVHICEQH